MILFHRFVSRSKLMHMHKILMALLRLILWSWMFWPGKKFRSKEVKSRNLGQIEVKCLSEAGQIWHIEADFSLFSVWNKWIEVILSPHINHLWVLQTFYMNDINDGPARNLNLQPSTYQVNTLPTELLGLACLPCVNRWSTFHILLY